MYRTLELGAAFEARQSFCMAPEKAPSSPAADHHNYFLSANSMDSVGRRYDGASTCRLQRRSTSMVPGMEDWRTVEFERVG